MNEENIPQKDESTDFIDAENLSEKPARPIWVVILAIAGIIAVLTALGIGIFQLAGRAPENISEIGSNLGNLFRGEEKLVLSTESMTVASGEEVSLAITHKNNKSKGAGIYTIEFICGDGVSVELEGAAVDCNKQTEISAIDKDVHFSLTSDEERYIDVTVKVFFMSEESDLESDISLTVVNRNIASTNPNEETPTPAEPTKEPETPTTKPAEPAKEETKTPQFITVEHRGSRYSDPNGTPDLKVTINDVGYYLNEDKSFVSTDRIRARDRAVVKFTVENVGNKETGNWYFSSLLPIEGDRYYRSGSQISLQPGDKMVFTLAFDGMSYRGEDTLYINVDPLDQIKEISELNNIAQAKFRVNR